MESRFINIGGSTFSVSVKPNQPTPYDETLRQCFEALSVLKDVWFSRAKCVSLANVQKVDIDLFSFSHVLHSQHVANIDSIRELPENAMAIRVPRNLQEQDKQKVLLARSQLVGGLQKILALYDAQPTNDPLMNLNGV